MSLDETALVEAVRSGVPDVRAVLVAGSWARGEADPSSDIDVVAVWNASERALRVGVFQGRLTEVLYLPAAALDRRPIQRATLRGARILWDPDHVAAERLARVASVLAKPPPPDPTQAAYGRWDLAQSLRTMAWLAGHDPASLLLMRGRFVEELLAHVFRLESVWPPTVRRQLPVLADRRPDAYRLICACLEAVEPDAIVQRAEEAFAALVAGDPPRELGSAPLLPLPSA